MYQVLFYRRISVSDNMVPILVVVVDPYDVNRTWNWQIYKEGCDWFVSTVYG